MPWRWAAIALFVLATRLAHAPLLWIEEAYPAAAAIEVLHGRLPYRDFFFDKPPLSALVYLLWGAWDGVPLRLAGALFVLAAAWLLSRLAAHLWSEREGMWAAALTACFLTFDTPSAVMALAPDLLMVLPHAAAALLVALGSPLAAGVAVGVAFWINPKALLVAAALALWRPRAALRLGIGFAGLAAAGCASLAALGALNGYWEHVWQWGAAYSADSPVNAPWREGLLRTANWAGFHAALVVGAALAWRRGERRLFLWLAVSFAAVAMGTRFAPRYYFQLLPVAVLLGARGATLRPLLLGALLLIPVARFGPRFLQGFDNWADTAMNRDSQAAASIIRNAARPGDTILVWGYRPDVLIYSRLSLGAPFLDSQPLTGVLADRHLRDSRPTFAHLARENRRRLLDTRPTFLVDGLGPYNPALAVDRFPDLSPWLHQYRLLSSTAGSRVYVLRGR